MKIDHKVNHTKARSNEYPKIEEQLDLIYKGFVEQQEGGKELPPSHQKFVELIKEIKQKYPKSS